MKRLSTLFLTLLLCLLALPAAAVEVATLTAGGLFRLKSSTNQYLYEAADHTVLGRATSAAADWNELWVFTTVDGQLLLLNAGTGRSIPAAGTSVLSTTPTYAVFYAKKDGETFVLSTTNNYAAGTCLSLNASNQLVRANADAATSKWTIEPVSTYTNEQIKAQLCTALGVVSTPTPGAYYRLRNVKNTGVEITENTNNELKGRASETGKYTQCWQISSASNDQWTFRNALTDNYISNNLSLSATVRTIANNSAAAFQIGQENTLLPIVSIKRQNNNNNALHFAPHQDNSVVTWKAASYASAWFIVPENLNAEQLAAAKTKYSEFSNINTNRATLNAALRTFFADNACTQLLPEHQGKSDEALKADMQAAGLPLAVQEMAVRVKRDSWSTNAEANTLIKDFRIHSYVAHSDPNKWTANDLVPTSFGRYSHLTNATGVTLNAGEYAYLYVDQAAPTGTTLQAQIVSAYSPTGTLVNLVPGINVVSAEQASHLYIYYNIDDVNIKLASIPALKIHIEGGRVNGYFDLARHTNDTWLKMRQLRDEGFLQDEVFRMISRRFAFSYNLQQMIRQDDNQEWHYNGEYKGIVGALKKWDEIADMELEFLSIERYADRFNCLLFNCSNDGVYSTTYGVYMGSSIMNYRAIAFSSQNGGNLWGAAHEVGHQWQKLFNIAGCLESSNNVWSQIALWRSGTTVGRGNPLQDLLDHYNNGGHWFNTNIGKRYQLYWKLYLYFVELGHKPTFFKELMDRFRTNPINQSNARTDFLHFAKTCSEVAGEDLTDFFEMFGFFRVPTGLQTVPYNDNFYDNRYQLPKVQVDAADVQATLAEMAKLPKKGAANMFFIDERIHPIPTTYEGAPEGAIRQQVQDNATPGDANEVGDVGMYTDFAPGKQPTPSPASVLITERMISIKGTGAVGYKVYDKTGKLVFLSNRNTFFLPSTLNLADLTVKVAGGAGQDVEIIKDGQVLPQYAATEENFPFNNTAGLHLSTDKANPEYPYNIHNTTQPTYYLSASTTSTTKAAERGRFAFFRGINDGEYFIYSLDSAKWLAYTDAAGGNNKIVYLSERNAQSLWRIALEANGTSFDVFPPSSTNGWNWYGGVTAARTSMGLYNITDNNSTWTFIPTSLKVYLSDLIRLAEVDLARTGVGYPAEGSTARATLRKAIERANALADPTMTDLAQFYLAHNTYTRVKNELQMPEDGKVYRIRHYVAGRMIANAEATESNGRVRSLSFTDTDGQNTHWVCQKTAGADQFVFASLVGNGYLGKTAGEYRGQLSATPTLFTLPAGSKHGYLSLRTDNSSFSGGGTVVEGVNAVVSNGSGWGTDFYFEEVPNATFPLTVRAARNGNFATLCLPFATTLPAELSANSLTIEGERGLLNELSGKLLPAHTAVVISATAAGTHQLVPAPHAAQLGDTQLTGTIQRILNANVDRTSQNYYLLQLRGGVATFNLLGTANIPANRAYFTQPLGSNVPTQGFVLGTDRLTGVDALRSGAAADSAEPLYDLPGRRIVVPVRGQVYLKGRRRVLAR